ncbi:uncharacterized protein EV420DRAFT_1648366 [Desarmillaria tabescens]|uniref:Uncharacterized protein n=1 Tax=Armillaria tabescens TaxID=1929756 RepID=A0AA39MSP1_ARMTA|nr:uncharacterized protein EV420DRAFT_1648366 [Desarmillaria tabescens]KAK0445651.1 hypothetical protein EV420DRAFT_1648366 [Desarmillaria tabescens]
MLSLFFQPSMPLGFFNVISFSLHCLNSSPGPVIDSDIYEHPLHRPVNLLDSNVHEYDLLDGTAWTNTFRLDILSDGYPYSLNDTDLSIRVTPLMRARRASLGAHSSDERPLTYTLHETTGIDLRPVSVTGDVISLDDIYNWKTGENNYLDDVGDMKCDHYNQVIFTMQTILLVAYSINFYTIPPILDRKAHTSVATDSFGWVEGASATLTSISI